jgi:hypothetical protein
VKSATEILWIGGKACVRSGQQIRVGKTGEWICRAADLFGRRMDELKWKTNS